MAQHIPLACPLTLDSRLEHLFDLGGGVLFNPLMRFQDEGRALAALEPVAAPLSVLVRRWAWPMPRRWGSEGASPGQFYGPVASGVCDIPRDTQPSQSKTGVIHRHL